MSVLYENPQTKHSKSLLFDGNKNNYFMVLVLAYFFLTSDDHVV